MHRLLARCLLLLFFVHASSCSVTKTVRSTKTNTASSPKVVKPTPPKTPVKALPLTTNEKVANYLQRFGSIAQAEMKQYKIPASITLAQGLLESGFGEGRLAVQANNHFGIKCHSTWQGKRIYHDDDEKGECFRVYENPAASYRDHSLFLRDRSRYAFLFQLGKKDYRAWAKGLKKAGYATDPKYPQKLIGLIERFELYAYDQKKTVVQPTKKQKKNSNDTHYYVVKKGDTLYSIAKRFNVNLSRIVQLNRIQNNTIYLGQELILPKK